MSAWDHPDWRSVEACVVCRRGGPLHALVDLEVSTLTLSEQGTMRGNCTLFARRHVVELHELSDEEAAAFMRDLRRVGRAVQAATGAVKLNHEQHGNTLPHLHVHVYPRYPGDPFEGGPIDPRRIQGTPYAPGEYDAFRQTLLRLLTS